ncbi:hypothetical protein D3C87_20720 [compost metagenome]
MNFKISPQMRKRTGLVQLTLLVSLLLIFTTSKSVAQCVITSTDGYVVSVSIQPKSIAVSTTDCPWGYNYNVNFDYNISITGPNAAAMYTLQARIYCANSAMNGAYSLPLNGGIGSAQTTTNPSVPHNGTAYGYNAPYPSCNNATVATLNCTTVDVVIHGPGIPYRVIHCNNIGSVLPVEFLSFEGEKKNDGNLLLWQVQSEQRNDYFTIETSRDGLNWKELAQVKGAINSTELKSYSYLDTKNTQGAVYYKLSQTDLDGSRNELSIRYISSEEADFRLYPNPSADGRIHVSFSDHSEAKSTISLRNEVGQLVHQEDLEPASKSGKVAYYNSDLYLNQPAGVYFVEVRSNDDVVNRSKLVIR